MTGQGRGLVDIHQPVGGHASAGRGAGAELHAAPTTPPSDCGPRLSHAPALCSVAIDQLCVHECHVIGEGGQFWPAPTFKVRSAACWLTQRQLHKPAGHVQLGLHDGLPCLAWLLCRLASSPQCHGSLTWPSCPNCPTPLAPQVVALDRTNEPLLRMPCNCRCFASRCIDLNRAPQVVALDRPDEPLIAKSCTGCWTGVSLPALACGMLRRTRWWCCGVQAGGLLSAINKPVWAAPASCAYVPSRRHSSRAYSPYHHHTQILKRINAEIEARRRAGEDLPPPPKTAIAGPEYFGFNQPNVGAAL